MRFKDFFSKLSHKEKVSLANEVGASYLYLCHLANGHKKAGAKYLAAIPKATNGVVTAEMLRPDLYQQTAQ